MSKLSLLEFAKTAITILDTCSADSFAETFVKLKVTYWHEYSNGLVCSNSHGIEFFNNIIKYWDNPDTYYTRDPKQPKKKQDEVDYEENFIGIIKNNKIISQ